MLRNLQFAGLKLVYHSLIKCLYNWLNYDPSVWAFVQLIIPFLEESNISILEKFTLITKSISWAFKLLFWSHSTPTSQNKHV